MLLEETGHFCSRNNILRALSHAKLFSEGALHKLWATHPMFEMYVRGPFKCYTQTSSPLTFDYVASL